MTDRLDALADRLAARVADELVERVGEMLDERAAEPEPLLDAAQAAKLLGVDRATVYQMAKDGRLPAVKLGDSNRPRLRFDRRELVKPKPVEPERGPLNGRRRRRPRSPRTDLLPVKGAKP